MNKPELLLPVGNVEAFYAALQGGADAIYLGLKYFNARGRASNFSNFQFLLLLQEAEKHNVKVYVTLNIVVKNKEIPELLNVLWFLSKTKVSAVIIQDWGTYFLLKNYFPNLVVHASTQMANHNSLGLIHCKKLGFERVILARELTLSELKLIQDKPALETEIFVHGALCYSFSGMCLFSSYLGGAGANRGLCTQPCRRVYQNDNDKNQVFSLKDNQLVDFIPQFAKMGISSLKVEGRLKSGEYVYRVAQAYRKVIDKGDKQINIAKDELRLDMGREKTQWFYSPQVKYAVAEKSYTGLALGRVEEVGEDYFCITPSIELKVGNRLRIRTKNDNEQINFKISKVEQISNDKVKIYTDIAKKIRVGNEVFMASLSELKFPNKLKGKVKRMPQEMPNNVKRKIIANIRKFKPANQQIVYFRINTPEWLRKINLNQIDRLILHISKAHWKDFDIKAPFLLKNKNKIWIELPQFISEKHLDFYKDLCKNLVKMGYTQFSLSHLAQKELLPKGCTFITNENVYCYNDAAARLLFSEGAKGITSPFENEFDNLLSGANRNVIVPMFYYPKLFYSRQPVNTATTIQNDNNQTFNKHIQNGITIITPENPVALFQYSKKLQSKGFKQFLIDLSFEKPSKHTVKRLLNKLKKSEQEQPSTTFNFKKGFK